jgi:flagellar assembly protein FliH
MFLFKAFPGNTPVQSFIALLKPVVVEPKESKGHRTAAGIEELKEAAKTEGFALGKDLGYAEGLEQGNVEGFAAGQAEGYQTAYTEAANAKQAELDSLKDQFQSLIARVEDSMDAWYRGAEPEMAQLSVLIASRILARELRITPDSILAMTREAVSEVTHAKSARIRVNPFDLPVLEEHKSAIMAASASLRELEIIEDPDILAGCVIESDGGVIESLVDEKIAEVLRTVRSAA